jgi:hypothetical protein
MKILNDNIENVKKLCMKYHVGRLYVFGSVTGTSFNDDSDIDFIVSFKNVNLDEYADNYFEFKFSLKDLLNRDIDLLEENAMNNPFLMRTIDATKKLVYEA